MVRRVGGSSPLEGSARAPKRSDRRLEGTVTVATSATSIRALRARIGDARACAKPSGVKLRVCLI
jgi:hypothetical protein